MEDLTTAATPLSLVLLGTKSFCALKAGCQGGPLFSDFTESVITIRINLFIASTFVATHPASGCHC